MSNVYMHACVHVHACHSLSLSLFVSVCVCAFVLRNLDIYLWMLKIYRLLMFVHRHLSGTLPMPAFILTKLEKAVCLWAPWVWGLGIPVPLLQSCPVGVFGE